MQIELTGRKAIITGSTAGIGRATAEGLARAGASVVINGRGSARTDEAVRQMQQRFPDRDISGIAADLSTPEGAEAFFAQVLDADILINNVGTAHIREYNGIESIAKIPDEDFRRKPENRSPLRANEKLGYSFTWVFPWHRRRAFRRSRQGLLP